MYSGKVRSFNTTLTSFFDENLGMSEYVKKQFVKRFEINHFIAKREESFTSLTLERRKIINMYLSRIISINNNINELIKYNLIRLYLIKTFKGRCHALGKPVRGQRTWSNASTSYRYNRIIRYFVYQVKKNNTTEKKKVTLNTKMIKKKTKKTAPKIKMIITKKKKNLWF